MKFTIQTPLLKTALATLKPIAKPNTTHAILGNICITAEKDSVTLLAMDLEKQLSITLPAQVKSKGSTTIPASKLHDSVAKLKSSECSFESNDKQQGTIRGGTAVSNFLGLPIEDLPPRIDVNEGEGVMIPAETFNTLMSNSLLHANTDPTRALLCSVIVLSRNGKLAFQASDFKHAVICQTDIRFSNEAKFIIPRESVPAMVKIADSGELELTFGSNTMSVKSDGMEFRTKLIEAERLPNFDDAYPKERALKITVSKEDLLGIVEYAEVQTSEIAQSVTLICDSNSITARGSKVISAAEGEFFDMNEDSAKVKKGSASVEVKLMPGQIRDALKCMVGEEVTLEMESNIRPVVIQEPDHGVLCFICPMRINS